MTFIKKNDTIHPMREITNNELSNYKVLPFDLYAENKSKILSAGEVLTPGKLIMLKSYSKIYTEDLNKSETEHKSSGNQQSTGSISNFTYESLNPEEFDTVVNKDSLLNIDSQIKIKYFFKKIMDMIAKDYYEDSALKLQSLVNILKNEIYKRFPKSEKGSQVRFLGEYEICHPLNVAVISGLIAKKLEYSPRHFEEVILAALLHDIGKIKMEIPDESALTTTNEDEVKNHTLIGYKLIKEDMGFPELIAKPALEHHENNDGSGYPKGLSNDFIHEYSQIVNVANYYDNLAFNRTHILVLNSKEAMRAMLETGTRKFAAKTLYTLIHMFNYDDLKDFNDMII